jgi:uncharacterized protein YggE
VRAEALETAHQKAEQLAKAAGVELGKPIVILESSSGGDYYPMAYNKAVMAVAEEAAYDSVGLEAGESEVRVVVNVTYEIK